MVRFFWFFIENGWETKYLMVILCVLWVKVKEESLENEICFKGLYISKERVICLRYISLFSFCVGRGWWEGIGFILLRVVGID